MTPRYGAPRSSTAGTRPAGRIPGPSLRRRSRSQVSGSERARLLRARRRVGSLPREVRFHPWPRPPAGQPRLDTGWHLRWPRSGCVSPRREPRGHGRSTAASASRTVSHPEGGQQVATRYQRRVRLTRSALLLAPSGARRQPSYPCSAHVPQAPGRYRLVPGRAHCLRQAGHCSRSTPRVRYLLESRSLSEAQRPPHQGISINAGIDETTALCLDYRPACLSEQCGKSSGSKVWLLRLGAPGRPRGS